MCVTPIKKLARFNPIVDNPFVANFIVNKISVVNAFIVISVSTKMVFMVFTNIHNVITVVIYFIGATLIYLIFPFFTSFTLRTTQIKRPCNENNNNLKKNLLF